MMTIYNGRGNVWKWAEDLSFFSIFLFFISFSFRFFYFSFFFSLLFTFLKHWNLFWVYQNGNFYQEKTFHVGKKSEKVTLPPPPTYSSYVTAYESKCSNQCATVLISSKKVCLNLTLNNRWKHQIVLKLHPKKICRYEENTSKLYAFMVFEVPIGLKNKTTHNSISIIKCYSIMIFLQKRRKNQCGLVVKPMNLEKFLATFFFKDFTQH